MTPEELQETYIELEKVVAEENGVISLNTIEYVTKYLEENKDIIEKPTDVSQAQNDEDSICLMWIDFNNDRHVILKVFYEDGTIINADTRED